MGEAWSDWYAMDYLVNAGLAARRRATVGEVLVGKYVVAGQRPDPQPGDRLPGRGRAARACPGGSAAGAGWLHLRRLRPRSTARPRCTPTARSGPRRCGTCASAIGSRTTRRRSSPRHGAVAGRPVVPRHAQRDPRRPTPRSTAAPTTTTIWAVFAHRGMGYFAATVDGDDTEPVESFALPPAANTPTGVSPAPSSTPTRDAPAAGVRVDVRRPRLGLPGRRRRHRRRRRQVHPPGTAVGTYPYVVAARRGLRARHRPAVQPRGRRADEQPPSPAGDWALASGGGQITAFTGDDNSPFGCGPSRAHRRQARQRLGIEPDRRGPWVRRITVKLPGKRQREDVRDRSGRQPAAIPPDASTQAYKVETSSDGTTFDHRGAGLVPDHRRRQAQRDRARPPVARTSSTSASRRSPTSATPTTSSTCRSCRCTASSRAPQLRASPGRPRSSSARRRSSPRRRRSASPAARSSTARGRGRAPRTGRPSRTACAVRSGERSSRSRSA